MKLLFSLGVPGRSRLAFSSPFWSCVAKSLTEMTASESGVGAGQVCMDHRMFPVGLRKVKEASHPFLCP